MTHSQASENAKGDFDNTFGWKLKQRADMLKARALKARSVLTLAGRFPAPYTRGAVM
jgi:hypothetical protein